MFVRLCGWKLEGWKLRQRREGEEKEKRRKVVLTFSPLLFLTAFDGMSFCEVFGASSCTQRRTTKGKGRRTETKDEGPNRKSVETGGQKASKRTTKRGRKGSQRRKKTQKTTKRLCSKGYSTML